jgi:hypothetical protein
MKISNGLLCSFFCSSLIISCGGGGGGSNSCIPPTTLTPHQVTLTWAANREVAVNSTGGGYIITISGQPQTIIDVPFVATTSTPTTTIPLMSGCYTATITAYSALDPNSGLSATKASTSSPSTTIAISVP